jgi:hypothetical protein
VIGPALFHEVAAGLHNLHRDRPEAR